MANLLSEDFFIHETVRSQTSHQTRQTMISKASFAYRVAKSEIALT